MNKEKLSAFFKLMRADKPIGTALLLWPTMSAFFVLTNGSPSPFLMCLFVLGTFLMRSAGCVINDYFDRDFDGKVERTKDRPLPRGQVTEGEALILFGLLVAISASLLLWMNNLTFLTALAGLGLAVLYPLSKRFLAVPQLFLGLTFSWGILMVSAAETNQISYESLLLFTSCFFWIIAYDTAYALCDKQDDLDLGINSSAIYFGDYVVQFFLVFHVFSISLLVFMAYSLKLNSAFYFFTCAALVFAFYQSYLIKDQESEKCLRAFKNNNWLGLSILTGSILGVSL